MSTKKQTLAGSARDIDGLPIGADIFLYAYRANGGAGCFTPDDLAELVLGVSIIVAATVRRIGAEAAEDMCRKAIYSRA